MSHLLSKVFDELNQEYLRLMDSGHVGQPFLTAEKLCHQRLYLTGDLLAEVVSEDPSLLASRASDLIADNAERDNPSVGVIISSNIVMAGLERLLAVAVEHQWLEMDEEGHILVDEGELDPQRNYTVTADYSVSDVATQNLTQPGKSLLTKICQSAEDEFLDLLENEVHDAYQLALQVSGNHAVFSPEDLAPLISENPLLLGLRPDNVVDEELFAGDPPAGIIISGHLTHLLLDQLLDVAEQKGALAHDASGHLIIPEGDDDNPVIH